MHIRDAQQQALGFLINQLSTIEAQVIKQPYPEIQYPQLVPVVTTGNEWAKSTTFFSLAQVGQAEWFNHLAKDVPLADTVRSMFEHANHMAAIGYMYTLEELGQAMSVPGTNLSNDRADAARRAAEEKIDAVAMLGDVSKGITGLLNDPNVTVLTAGATGDGNSTHWTDKDADAMIADVNAALTGVYTGSLTVEIANTILLPIDAMLRLSNARIPNSMQSALDYLIKYNVYTNVTGQPLMIRGVRGLETAGDDGGGRMIAYRRDPQVLKLHLPMPHRFLDVWRTGPMIYYVPGILRTGGVEVRRPGAMRYVDGILTSPTT